MILATDGAERRGAVLDGRDLKLLRALLDAAIAGRAGTRLSATGLGPHLAPIDAMAGETLGPYARAVRAMAFDKNARTNWALGWHQDRTIAVRARADAPDFKAWTRKHGIDHAVPPVSLLQRMLTIRIHPDPVPADNAPLLIAPGSHRLGLVAEADTPAAVERCGTATCIADAGDVWIYASLILHASERSQRPARRRVLQLFYSADDLPRPLRWLGI